MAEGKQQHYIFGLVGVGSLAVLYFLWRESQQQTAPSTVVPAPSGGPQYPNVPVQPIQLGDVNITAPPETTYNVTLNGQVQPTVRVGNAHSDCGCQVNDCEAAGLPVTVQTIQDSLLKQMADNVASFHSKVASFQSKMVGHPGSA